ncbi:serine hydrolase [Cyanobacterium aponinum]|uniref:Serine hydrolase n=1 Tax=Cyanobacterium aponinum 0216 TaxID=2676140 RepID=A0A844GTG0_9CHRO|nr:serine hydrolase [Cyanobacterium aponinum]MTF39787.1 serine hydrolase [Cyanobacterium aponinum 0216]
MFNPTEFILNQSYSSKIEQYLQSYYKYRHFMGVVTILYGNQVIFNQGYGMADLEKQLPNTPETKFKIGSVTKQFTAAAILQLQEKGLLDVEKPLSTYLPNYPNGDRLTIHHLLTHTAGIPNLTSFPDYSVWMNQPTTLDKLINRFENLPLEFEPGTQHRYSNSGYIILTKVIEVVSGESYGDYIQKNLLQPLGMNSTGYLSTDVSGLAEGYILKGNEYQQADSINMDTAQGAGALYSTTADLGRWNQFLFANDDPMIQALSQDAIGTTASMISPQVSLGIDVAPNLFYGYGLVIDRESKLSRIGHSGGINGFTASLMYVPDLDITTIVLSNVQSVNPEAIATDLIAILTNESYEKPEPLEQVVITLKKLQTYVGNYYLMPGFDISIFIENNQLQAQGTGQPAINLYPVSEKTFVSFSPKLTIVFNSNTNGIVESFTLFQGEQENIAYKVD